MTDWLTVAFFSIGSALLAVSIIGVAFSAVMPALGRWNRRFFVLFFSLLFLYVIVILLELISYSSPEMVKAQRVIILFEFLFFSVLTLMPMPFLLHCAKENIKGSRLFRAAVALWGVFIALLIAAQFTNAFYGTNPALAYVRGPWFPLLITPLVALTLLNTVSLFLKRKKLSKELFVALLIYLLPAAIMVFLYMFAAVDILVSFWLVLCAITMFGLIFRKSVKEYMNQQREIANQRANVMVLQMRPHFIYNTLMSIYSLCNQDPQKARQVTLDFTNYLRKNFSAVAGDSTIPFTSELEHTRAYLAVEQAQYEDLLLVHFDTPHTHFRVPPLTLQPIAENAVKHGMNPYGGPLHLSIRTRETSLGSEIIVENDGADFNAAKENNEPHIALSNIRQRLEIMCGGTLTILARDGGGTIVKVTIPFKRPLESDHP
ncbi:MAG: histidine kinase [Clostridia bacterium]|nr:histidine kinase [Clostridia bacterium]